MQINRTQLLVRFLAVGIAIAIFEYVLLYNFPLASVSKALEGKELSILGPKDRVKKEEVLGEEVEKQVEDIIYFSTKTSGYDKATIKVTYQNQSPEQEIYIGFKDQSGWHYKTVPLDLPLINNLTWPSVKSANGTLFQKKERYSSFEEFIADPPAESVVGFYHGSKIDAHESVLVGHIPSDNKITTIDTPLRGAHTLYAYLKNEPFKFRFTKQDLNWYDGEDTLTVKVFKNNKLMTEKTLLDDGVADSSGAVNQPEEIIIEYDGEGHPATGVYKIVMEAGGDVVIKKIDTTLKHLVFAGPIFPINNNNVYSDQIVKTEPLSLFTNAKELSFKTNHVGGLQDIRVGEITIPVTDVQMEYTYTPDAKESEIQLTFGDMIINGIGFFAFSKDQFFTPKTYLEYPIVKQDDIEKVDFVLTNYSPPTEINNWKTKTIDFDLKDAFYQNGELSWIIKSPGIKERGGEILFKKLDVTMHKDAIIK